MLYLLSFDAGNVRCDNGSNQTEVLLEIRSTKKLLIDNLIARPNRSTKRSIYEREFGQFYFVTFQVRSHIYLDSFCDNYEFYHNYLCLVSFHRLHSHNQITIR